MLSKAQKDDMKFNISNIPVAVVVLILVLVLQSAGLAWLMVQNHTLSGDVSTLQRTSASKDDLAASQRLLNGSISNVFGAEKPVMDAQTLSVYLPEFKIKLPYNSTTKTIAYTLRNDNNPRSNDPAEADVTSTRYVAPEKETVVDCSDFLRLKIEAAPHTYSPHEKATSVKLADGRTLQIYEAINEAECTQSWNIFISPAALADVFKQAESY